jgi:cob(I)alamin adenosyltransferase
MITVTTKAGDKGVTGLANGERLGKEEPVFAAIGGVDELNSWLGLIVARLDGRYPKQKKFLLFVQDKLFVMGGELAQAPKCKITEGFLKKIEDQAEQLQKEMAEGWHTQFLLPGGTELSAWIDIARTVCRRCERVLVSYGTQYKVSPVLLKSVNRLSDYLYILRCWINWHAQYSEKKFGKNDEK